MPTGMPSDDSLAVRYRPRGALTAREVIARALYADMFPNKDFSSLPYDVQFNYRASADRVLKILTFYFKVEPK